LDSEKAVHGSANENSETEGFGPTREAVAGSARGLSSATGAENIAAEISRTNAKHAT
jgi:hypothetical protein